MILMIDNYDSFTFNLVRYCEELGLETLVRANDTITLNEIDALAPEAILISPGPGRPEDAGICLEVIQIFSGKIPILGICLGHQAIAQVFGAKIVTSAKIMHGKTSPCYHVNTGLFENLDFPLEVARYHSLVVDKNSLSPMLKVTAWTLDEYECVDEVMAIEHENMMVSGVQFHPEAILSQSGHEVLRLFFKRHSIEVHETPPNELQTTPYDEG